MADNVSLTPGSGVVVRSDDVGGVHYQYVKLDVGGDGVAKPVIQGGTDGVPVDVLSVAGDVSTKPKAGQTWPISAASAIPVSDNGGSFTVDAPVGTPLFARLSDGTNPITILPVSGTVTAAQGTAAASSSGWPTKITDGTDTVGISTVGGAKLLKVDVVQSVAGGASQADLSTLANVNPIAGDYNEAASDPSAGQAAAVRLTLKRALHVNIRKVDGTELGIAATPLRTDPTGSTTQPVSGTVTVNLKDASNAAFSATNPVPVQVTSSGRTRVTKSVAISASQTASAIWTPAGGKKFVITFIDVAISVTGTLTVFDNTNSASNIVFDGTQPTGARSLPFCATPFVSVAADNVLRYTSGAGMTGVFTVHGYEE